MTNPIETLPGYTRRAALEALAEAAETSLVDCPTCGKPANLLVDKGDRFQVWHPGRLFPCGAPVA